MNYRPSSGNLDLHAHPFMKEGLGPLFRGSFHEERLHATCWSDKLSSQINVRTLEESGLDLVVVSLYAHPILSGGRKNAVRRQLGQAEKFVATHPDWVLARSPDEALAARTRGNRVLVLALEGAAGIVDTETDMREFIDDRGIRIVTFMHLTDDYLGGVAFFSSFKGFLLTPHTWAAQLLAPKRDEAGVRVNRRGLTTAGRRLAEKLIERKVWIDLSHASDATQRDLLPLLQTAGQPPLHTHSPLRRYVGMERGLSDAQITVIAERGGLVGLMPAHDMLQGTFVDHTNAGAVGGRPDDPDDDLRRLARQYTELATRIGAASTMIGSDFNGAVAHLAPPKRPTGTALDREGLWHIGQSAALWAALKQLEVPWPEQPDAFVATFLERWSRVFHR